VNRTVLISGGGRGIGRAAALAFARDGFAVAVGARTTAEVEAVADDCRAVGVPALALRLDVSDRASCDAAVERCLQEWTRLDVLVNNAGTASSHKFTDVDDETWERTLRVDLTGAFYLTRAAVPQMLERGEGAVISVASIASRQGAPYIAPYVAAKHGLLGLMRSLAAEYARSGVTFNCVCPAYVDTPMTEGAIATIMRKTGRSYEEALRPLLTPQGRLVRPEEVAAICLFLAGPLARSITGQAINVDGGWVQS
jgi:NAD(P)-dependent dehydrogenase (short-subunit alcohol dehydrogenase family)